MAIINNARISCCSVWVTHHAGVERFPRFSGDCGRRNTRILLKELKELAQCGLISRHEHSTIPPRTADASTARGSTLRPLMAAMADWGLAHRADGLPAMGQRT
jgi:DNA-binding HxlR family transcriptional regulator